MISFWRHGFGPDTFWDVHNAPSGDYRITIRRGAAGQPKHPSNDDAFWMKRRISEIVHFAMPHTLFSLDSRVVQNLLDIHAAACPLARHPSARTLLRDRRFGAYLRTVSDDLAHAVSQRRLHIERLERPRPLESVAIPAPSEDRQVGTGARVNLQPMRMFQGVIKRVQRYLRFR